MEIDTLRNVNFVCENFQRQCLHFSVVKSIEKIPQRINFFPPKAKESSSGLSLYIFRNSSVIMEALLGTHIDYLFGFESLSSIAIYIFKKVIYILKSS